MVIYCTTNLINGIKYIGKDKNNDHNYLGSGTLLKKAIKEFGKKNFKKTIIEYCNNLINLVEREIYWLEYYDAAKNPNYYNLTNKAFGNSGLSEETKAKISKAKKGKKHTEQAKINIGLGRIGIKHVKEHPRGKECKIYGTIRSEEFRNNQSERMKLQPRTQEWNNNIRKNRENCIKSKIKTIEQYDLQNNLIKEWNSMTEARKITKILGIPHCAGGFTKTSGGFIWKYKEKNKI